MAQDRDCRALTAVWGFPAIIFGILFFFGKSVYWGDLTYIHYPWRTLASEMVQRGTLPLWDPYAYFGMPLAAEMQSAVWYPGTLPFYLLPFAGALSLYYLIHYGLAGVFTFLWLRRERYSRSAAAAGSLAFIGSGILVSRVPFLNHLSTLTYLPAFLLFSGEVWLLSISFVLCFLSGYPLMLAGGALSAVCISRTLGRYHSEGRTWLVAAAAGVPASACLLLPAIELAIHSHRGAGLNLEDTLQFGLTPGDFLQFLSPVFIAAGGFSTTLYWWKTCYFGICAWVLTGVAFVRLRRRGQLAAAAFFTAVLLLLLGGSTPSSEWIWAHFAPLRYVRYPGNLTYLVLPLISVLVAIGLHRRPWGWRATAVLAVELVSYAAVSQPVVSHGYFTDAGSLAHRLQQSLGDGRAHRYLLSPRALEWHRGHGADFQSASLDLKHRFYGLTNLPYHLPAAANFGEPLVPNSSYEFMDFLYRQPGVDAVAPYLSWADVKLLLTRDPFPSTRMDFLGQNLWYMYGVREPISRAMWFSESDGVILPHGIKEGNSLPDIRKGIPVAFERGEENLLLISGRTRIGWLYLSEPRLPGWRIWLNRIPVTSEPALGAFQKLRVPEGNWTIRLLYDPPLWEIGLLLTLLSIGVAAAYWYNRTIRMLL